MSVLCSDGVTGYRCAVVGGQELSTIGLLARAPLRATVTDFTGGLNIGGPSSNGCSLTKGLGTLVFSN
jgi:hypothetical protein